MELAYILNPSEPPQLGGASGGGLTLSSLSSVANTGVGGMALSLLQPSGFDNLVDSLGLGSLFGQTSEEVFATVGINEFNRLLSIFQNSFTANPSEALTTFSKGLYSYKANLEVQLAGASSSRTKNGLPISLKAITDGIEKLNGIIADIKKQYSVITTYGSGVSNGKTYQYPKYEVKEALTSPSTVAKGKVELDENGNVVNESKPWYFWLLILALPFGSVVWLISVILKKRK